MFNKESKVYVGFLKKDNIFIIGCYNKMYYRRNFSNFLIIVEIKYI